MGGMVCIGLGCSCEVFCGGVDDVKVACACFVVECFGVGEYSSSIVGSMESTCFTDPLKRGLVTCSSLYLASLRFFQRVKAVTVPPSPMIRPMIIV